MTRLAATPDADFMWPGRQVADLPSFGELTSLPAFVVLGDMVRSACGEPSLCSPIDDMAWLVPRNDIRFDDLSFVTFLRSALGLDPLACGTDAAALGEGAGGAGSHVLLSPLPGQILPKTASMLPMLD